MRRVLTAFIVVFGLAAAALAQAPPARQARQERRPPGEVARLFEAYAVVQAQEMLALDEEQYGRFLVRFKALQEARRQHQVARVKLLQELGRLAGPGNAAVDESALRERLKALEDQDARGRADIARAEAVVDEALTVRQRAMFRLFEEQMERKKLELMSRARQAVRPQQRRVPQQE
jgi:hypothetical protein